EGSAAMNHGCSPPMRAATSIAWAATKAAAPANAPFTRDLGITDHPRVAAVDEAGVGDEIADVAAPVGPEHPPAPPVAAERGVADVVAVAARLVSRAVQPDERKVAARIVGVQRRHEIVREPCQGAGARAAVVRLRGRLRLRREV